MIGYNNQGVKLAPYHAPIPLMVRYTTKSMLYTKPSEVDRAWPSFGPPGIFK